MPLSEQEQRLLDEMERSLYHGDTDFGAGVRRVRTGLPYGVMVGGILLALAGLGALVLAVLLQSWPVGALGFAAMLGGVLLATGRSARTRSAAVAGSARSGGFMERLSARWERRRQR